MVSVPRDELDEFLSYVRRKYINTSTPTEKMRDAAMILQSDLSSQSGEMIETNVDALRLLCKNVRLSEPQLDGDIEDVIQALETQFQDPAKDTPKVKIPDPSGTGSTTDERVPVADPIADVVEFQERKYELHYDGEQQTLKEGTGNRWGKDISLHGDQDAKLHLQITSHMLKVAVRHSPPSQRFDTVVTRLRQTDDDDSEEYVFVPPVTDPTLPEDFSVTLVDVGAAEQEEADTENQAETDRDEFAGIPSNCEVCPGHGRTGHRRNEATHSILNDEGDRMEIRYICEACIDDEDLEGYATLDPLE